MSALRSPWVTASGNDAYAAPGDPMYALHERLLRSLAPSDCPPDKFARALNFALNMTQVVLEEHYPASFVGGDLPGSIAQMVARRNCEHSAVSLLCPPAVAMG